LLRLNRAYSDNRLFAWHSASARAGHGIGISKAKALDLMFNLFPLTTQTFEGNNVPALQMSPQLLVVQEPSVNAFHSASSIHQYY
jgi:hypothetical protein